MSGLGGTLARLAVLDDAVVDPGHDARDGDLRIEQLRTVHAELVHGVLVARARQHEVGNRRQIDRVATGLDLRLRTRNIGLAGLSESSRRDEHERESEFHPIESSSRVPRDRATTRSRLTRPVGSSAPRDSPNSGCPTRRINPAAVTTKSSASRAARALPSANG